jgi:tetratricopeptide (TPR) repeat protein/transcriptional regulator with XRE-family HTH domain
MTTTPPSSFGELFRRYRNAAGLSLEKVARASSIPIGTIKRWDGGQTHSVQCWQDLLRLAAVLKLTRGQTNTLLNTASLAHLEQLFQHALSAEDQALFNPWQDIISGPSDMQRLLNEMPLDTIPAPGPLPRGSRVPYAANPHFMGRDTLMRELARLFHSGADLTKGPRAVVVGLGGIGKTSIAAEFVHRYGRYFAGGVFWLNLGNPAAVASEVAAYGGRGYLELYLTPGDLTLDDQVRLVQLAWEQEVPRLLIFDNCEDPTLAQQWLPITGGCRVLITSQRQRWPASLGLSTLPLDTLKRSVSIDLLQRLAQRLSTDEADAVAEELGDLPLALQLGGSYLAEFQWTSVNEYLDGLRSTTIMEHPSLRGEHDNDISVTRHDRHVGRTFLLSYQRLDRTVERDHLAIDILIRAASFAPGELIPIVPLLASVNLRPELMPGQAALGRLTDLGLLRVEETGVRLHRLVGRFAQAVITDPTAQPAVERAVISYATAISDDGQAVAMKTLLVHLQRLTRHAASRTDPLMAQLCLQVGICLKTIGDYASAQPASEQALALHEHAFGATHPDTATCLNHLAGIHWAMGNYSTAQSLYERALSIRESVFGRTHASTAKTLNDMAALAYSLGDYPTACSLCTEALAIFEATLGTIHAATAESLNNLGLFLLERGDYDAARLPSERAITMYEQTVGPMHPDTATSLNNRALLLEYVGEFTEAGLLHERALAIREHIQGPKHPATAQTLHNLGAFLHTVGNYNRSFYYYERAIEIFTETWGINHPDTATALGGLATLLETMADYKGARRLAEQALAIREQVLGPCHPDVAVSLNNLAGLLDTIGEYPAAKALYERALGICEEALGPNHPLTATCLSNLGHTLQAMREYAEAQSRYEQALTIRQATLGPSHPDVAHSLNKLALLYQAVGNVQVARRLFEQALAIREATLDPHHADLATSLNNLAELYQLVGRHDTAKPLLERALAIREAAFGPTHPDTHKTKSNLAACTP